MHAIDAQNSLAYQTLGANINVKSGGSSDDSAIHNYAGYVVFGLVVLRLLWGLVGTKYARFSAFWPHRKDIVAHLKGLLSRRNEPPLSHNPLGAVMIFNLLAALVLISVTGIMLTSDFFHDMDWVEDLHEGSQITP